jgi:hypothetical protein
VNLLLSYQSRQTNQGLQRVTLFLFILIAIQWEFFPSVGN